MSADDRPWWATDEGDLPGDGDDPLAAHRAARRGDRDPDRDRDGAPHGEAAGGAADDGSWWVPATEAVTRLARDLAAAAASPPRGLVDDEGADPVGGHRIDACGACPICVGLRALGESRPELVGHLAEAARQLALAVRTVVDAGVPADEAPGPTDAPRRAGPRRRTADDLRRIRLDD